MTTLICSGTLFSDWRSTLKKYLPTDSSGLSACAEISALAKEICQQQFPHLDELSWKPFTPDSKYINPASHLLSAVGKGSVFTWADSNSGLFLDFWKAAKDESRFILFYASPEYEFCHFIKAHKFAETHLENVLDAWLVRTRAMLTFFMHNRDRCLLINARTAASAQSSLIQAVREHFRLELEGSVLAVAPAEEISPLLEYLTTSLLLRNHDVSELYDEVRSAATVIGEADKSIASIEDRNKSLIDTFLNEVTAYKQLSDEHSLSQLQINQMAEELEYYCKRNIEQEKIINTMADYLSNDPLLKIARQARQMQ